MFNESSLLVPHSTGRISSWLWAWASLTSSSAERDLAGFGLGEHLVFSCVFAVGKHLEPYVFCSGRTFSPCYDTDAKPYCNIDQCRCKGGLELSGRAATGCLRNNTEEFALNIQHKTPSLKVT